nr:MAG TPA: hypothetical protein [Caudoviricetes sp.]
MTSSICLIFNSFSRISLSYVPLCASCLFTFSPVRIFSYSLI